MFDFLKNLGKVREPKIEGGSSIDGTYLIQKDTDNGRIIYNWRTNKILFRIRPNINYAGESEGKYIARINETIDGVKKTFFVNDQGEIIFGKKYNHESLALVDSKSGEERPITPLRLVYGLLNNARIEENKDTLIEFIRDKEDIEDSVFNFYNRYGEILAENIPACDDRERVTDVIRSLATSLRFINSDESTLVKITYGGEFYGKTEIYKLNVPRIENVILEEVK